MPRDFQRKRLTTVISPVCNYTCALTTVNRTGDGSCTLFRYKFYIHGHDTGYSYDGVHGEEELRSLIDQPIATLNEIVCDHVTHKHIFKHNNKTAILFP